MFLLSMKAHSPKFSLTVGGFWYFTERTAAFSPLFPKLHFPMQKKGQLVWLYVKHIGLGNQYETWEWVSDPKCKKEQVCPIHCNCEILFEIERSQITGELKPSWFSKTGVQNFLYSL